MAFPGAEALPANAVIAAQAGRRWPFDESLRLAAATFATRTDRYQARTLQLRVAVLDAVSSEVPAGYAEQLDEDASFTLDPHGLVLDSARYDLAPGQRAFGVAIHNDSGSYSCVNANYGTSPHLFAVDGRQLKPLLRQFLWSWHAVSGDVCVESGPQVISEDATVTLAMGDRVHHGYRDIQLRARIERYGAANSKPVERNETRRCATTAATIDQCLPASGSGCTNPGTDSKEHHSDEFFRARIL